MAASNCEISFSWAIDRSPSDVTSYTLNDVISEVTDEEDNRYNFNRDLVLHLTRVAGTVEMDEHCTLHLLCHDHDCASINCITIISESRTVEISNNTEGYITTVRGRQLKTDPPDNGLVLYCCKVVFKEGYTNLTVKFLSLGERTSFCLSSLVISISQHTEDTSLHTRGTLDLERLKRDVSEMGNAVPDRARDLLTTMEQFKQNKLKNFEEILALQNQNIQQPLTRQNQGLTSIMSNILGVGTLQSLLGESNTENKSKDGGGLDMYKMLQKVCSSVAGMRAAALVSRENENSNASPDSGVDASSHDSEDDQHTVPVAAIMNFIGEKINQAKFELRAEFMEFKNDIKLQISQTNVEVNEKLDKIMCLLMDIRESRTMFS